MRARKVTEITCYVENQPGMLAGITKAFADRGVLIHGVQAYEGQLQSLVRMVVDQVDEAEKILRSFGVSALSKPDCLEVQVECKVGGLAEISNLLGQHDINIDSLYSADTPGSYTFSYFRVHDVDKAVEVINATLPELSK